MEAIGEQLTESEGSSGMVPEGFRRAGRFPAGHDAETPGHDAGTAGHGTGLAEYDGGTPVRAAGHLRPVPDSPAQRTAGPGAAGHGSLVHGPAVHVFPDSGVPISSAAVPGASDSGVAGPVTAYPERPELSELSEYWGERSDDPLDLAGIRTLLLAASVHARESLRSAGYIEAADFAAGVEELSRTVEFLQILAAGTVDHTRTRAIADATAHSTAARRARHSTWNAQGTETLNETDTHWPTPAPVVTSPADDGCRNTAEFLRLRLRIPIREARRRLTLAHHTLPGTTLTGTPTPPPHEHLATVLTPRDTSTGHPATTSTSPQSLTAPAVSSHAATIITATLDRLQHHTTAETLHGIEHHLTHAATTTDPDFLTRLAQRLTETIDADGTEPTEEALRHTQGAFIRKPRHGLHHIEIFATTDQYEPLLTAMNIATNPRTTTPNTSANTNGTEHTATTRVTTTDTTTPHHDSDHDTGDSSDSGDSGGGDADNPHSTRANQTPNLPDLERRTRPQQQLDGIITAVKTALTTNNLPTTGGNRPQIIATINHADLFPAPAAETHHTPTPAPAQAGAGAFVFTGPVAATTLRKIACDADIIPALLGTHGEILDLGRKTRLFTPAQRLALTARDQGCAFPDCTMPAPWCEAHHITYWSHGGKTTTTNGVLLCTHHHHLIHKEHWTITTTHNTPTFIPPPHIDPTQTPRQNHYFKPPPGLPAKHGQHNKPPPQHTPKD